MLTKQEICGVNASVVGSNPTFVIDEITQGESIAKKGGFESRTHLSHVSSVGGMKIPFLKFRLSFKKSI